MFRWKKMGRVFDPREIKDRTHTLDTQKIKTLSTGKRYFNKI